MSKRKQFHSIRRLYRIACKLSPLWDDMAVPARVAATTAMREFTGNWDCCEPARFYVDQFAAPRKRPYWVRRPIVTAACTRWLATH